MSCSKLEISAQIGEGAQSSRQYLFRYVIEPNDKVWEDVIIPMEEHGRYFRPGPLEGTQLMKLTDHEVERVTEWLGPQTIIDNNWMTMWSTSDATREQPGFIRHIGITKTRDAFARATAVNISDDLILRAEHQINGPRNENDDPILNHMREIDLLND